LTKDRQAVSGKESLGPLAFFESRTPTSLATNTTSTQLLEVLPPLWLLLRQLTSTQSLLPLPPL
jgi:hypothetical protein